LQNILRQCAKNTIYFKQALKLKSNKKKVINWWGVNNADFVSKFVFAAILTAEAAQNDISAASSEHAQKSNLPKIFLHVRPSACTKSKPLHLHVQLQLQ
jgi:hypothetical protein